MTLRIIHTADWQIGKSFRNFSPALAAELTAARLDVIGAIARIAAEKNAAHVLVAGDVFDGEGLDNLQLRRALARLGQEKAVTWLLLPGNHDPARAGGLWDRIARLDVPPNVVMLTTAAPYQLVADAVLLPAPLTSKKARPRSVRVDGAVRDAAGLVAHRSCARLGARI
jgi:DNA repair exonuclease SbcCD nuclease subunit